MKRAVIAAVAVAAVLLGCVGLSAAQQQQQPYVYNDAYRSHLLSRVSYCGAAAVSAWSCGMMCRGVPAFVVETLLRSTDGAAFGYIGVDRRNRQIAVVFRGTKSLGIWIKEMGVTRTPYSISPGCFGGCEVHLDTFTSYLSMRPQMYATLTKLIRGYPGFQVLVTGHSLGGALAVLAAVDLQEQFNHLPTPQKPIALYTFGAPRVGNRYFTRWAGLLLKGPHYRVVHAADPVPHLPPARDGYLHAPTEVFYRTPANSSMRVCVDSATAESRTCSSTITQWTIAHHQRYLGNPTNCVSIDPRTAVVEDEELSALLRSLLTAASTSSDSDV